MAAAGLGGTPQCEEELLFLLSLLFLPPPLRPLVGHSAAQGEPGAWVAPTFQSPLQRLPGLSVGLLRPWRGGGKVQEAGAGGSCSVKAQMLLLLPLALASTEDSWTRRPTLSPLNQHIHCLGLLGGLHGKEGSVRFVEAWGGCARGLGPRGLATGLQ